MIHPSYVELMAVVNDDVVIGEEPVVNSRYSIVSATAKRARQIIDGQEPMIPGAYDMKPLSIAVKELYEGDLRILTDEEAAQKAEEVAAMEAELAQKAEEDAKLAAEAEEDAEASEEA
ncbi:MAG: DNA-directed RNA polymerase subunit omega [Lachnospiraceae bacterium]|nr:DNA-directed RNA polymerase subunit omega [Lachnospiraceae bacterium]